MVRNKMIVNASIVFKVIYEYRPACEQEAHGLSAQLAVCEAEKRYSGVHSLDLRPLRGAVLCAADTNGGIAAKPPLGSV